MRSLILTISNFWRITMCLDDTVLNADDKELLMFSDFLQYKKGELVKTNLMRSIINPKDSIVYSLGFQPYDVVIFCGPVKREFAYDELIHHTNVALDLLNDIVMVNLDDATFIETLCGRGYKVHRDIPSVVLPNTISLDYDSFYKKRSDYRLCLLTPEYFIN